MTGRWLAIGIDCVLLASLSYLFISIGGRKQ